jgi:hypothetical protein
MDVEGGCHLGLDERSLLAAKAMGLGGLAGSEKHVLRDSSGSTSISHYPGE